VSVGLAQTRAGAARVLGEPDVVTDELWRKLMANAKLRWTNFRWMLD
jgi:hypothetical protein